MTSSTPPPVAERWSREGDGDRYAQARFANRRSAGRDPRLVEGLLRRFANQRPARILDVPCGAGRLQESLARVGPVTAVDVSFSMLAARARQAGATRGVQGSAWQLPLASDSFDLVVSCRLLHHIAEDTERAAVAAELVRVSRGLVLASFWDAASWHAFRRRHGLRRARHPDGRIAISRRLLASQFEDAGATVLGFAHSLRLISAQAWIAVRV